MQDIVTFLVEEYRTQLQAQTPTPSVESASNLDAFADWARTFLVAHPVVSQGYSDKGITVTLSNSVTVSLTPAPEMFSRNVDVLATPQPPTSAPRPDSGSIPVTGKVNK